MSVSLVLVREDGRQTEVPLKRAVLVLGRQTDCQIRIPGGGVSRYHCELTVGDGVASLRDLGSSNGTYVNRKRITQQDLAAGDLICVGEMVFVLRINDEPAEIDAEEAFDEGIVYPAVATKAASPGKPPAPARKAPPRPQKDNDSSSVVDFDFLDEDDEIKKQPKL